MGWVRLFGQADTQGYRTERWVSVIDWFGLGWVGLFFPFLPLPTAHPTLVNSTAPHTQLIDLADAVEVLEVELVEGVLDDLHLHLLQHVAHLRGGPELLRRVL